jgi:hypothetical protein
MDFILKKRRSDPRLGGMDDVDSMIEILTSFPKFQRVGRLHGCTSFQESIKRQQLAVSL